jgi:hypothetical protein
MARRKDEGQRMGGGKSALCRELVGWQGWLRRRKDKGGGRKYLRNSIATRGGLTWLYFSDEVARRRDEGQRTGGGKSALYRELVGGKGNRIHCYSRGSHAWLNFYMSHALPCVKYSILFDLNIRLLFYFLYLYKEMVFSHDLGCVRKPSVSASISGMYYLLIIN